MEAWKLGELRSTGRAGAPVPTWLLPATSPVLDQSPRVITSAAVLFNVVIENTAASIHACFATPFLMAVEITPVPIDLVSSRRSPACAPPFFRTLLGSMRPVTE